MLNHKSPPGGPAVLLHPGCPGSQTYVPGGQTVVSGTLSYQEELSHCHTILALRPDESLTFGRNSNFFYNNKNGKREI